MLISNQLKYLLAFALLVCSSCSVWQPAENTNATPFISEEIKNGIPFETKESDRFQTEIIAANYLHGEKNEKKYFLARDGAKRLTVFNHGEKEETSVLQTEDGSVFFIDHEKKTYHQASAPTAPKDSELNEFLTIEWLNQKTGAAFENLGTENNLTKYRVSLANSSDSEILIFVDENLKLPVKQEFYSMAGGEKKLTLAVELKNFLLSADENLFKLPQDYKKIDTK